MDPFMGNTKVCIGSKFILIKTIIKFRNFQVFERAFTETRADNRTAEIVFEQILPLRETC